MVNSFDDPVTRDAPDQADVVHEPDMANDLLVEIAPMSAEGRIDLNDPATSDMPTLNVAPGRAAERSNMERFTPVGDNRAFALTILRLTSEAIVEGSTDVADIVIRGLELEPEPAPDRKPSIAQVIGVSLSQLDNWHTGAERQVLTEIRIPVWGTRSQSAAAEIIALARKGRAFDSIGSLHRRHSGLKILEAGILAVAGTLEVWADYEWTTVRETGLRVLPES